MDPEHGLCDTCPDKAGALVVQVSILDEKINCHDLRSLRRVVSAASTNYPMIELNFCLACQLSYNA